MKKELFKSVIFFIGFLITGSYLADKVVFYSLNQISKNVYTGDSFGKFNFYLKEKEKFDVIIYGNSRANYNVNPSKISAKAFNVGLMRRSIAYSSTLIQLLPNSKQTLLVHIDLYNAFNNDYMGEDLDILNVFYHKNDLIEREIDKANLVNPLQHFYWSIVFNNKILPLFKNKVSPKLSSLQLKGYNPILPVSRETLYENEEFMLQDSNCLKNKLILNSRYNYYLKSIQKFALLNNKKVIYFTAPRFNDTCKTDNLLMQKIMLDMGETYWDLTDFSTFNQSNHYWNDRSHLNQIGAEILTDSIKSYLSNYEN